MILLGGLLSVKTIAFLTFCVFAIAAVGYLLGRITIKGVSLGTAGVFIVALVFGCFLYPQLSDQLLIGEETSYVSQALKIVENMGLVLFVTSVGFIAGPNFFSNLKKNFKSYVLLGLLIIVIAAVTCIGCIYFDTGVLGSTNKEEVKAMIVGLLSGSLTSTPAFSATKEAVGADLEGVVAVGHGIAYLFGVIGVVLFVQLVPKFSKANMADERAKIMVDKAASSKKEGKKKSLIDVDEFGFMALGLAIVLGIFIGGINYKNFSLTTTGGCLLVSLVLGHFGRIGKISLMPKEHTLKIMRELGLMLFLIGAGVAGGASFVQYFKAVYFIYGIIMTFVPMVIGYIFAKFVLKMPLLNNLGSITGGMTSTPALGTLIHVAGTEEVASAYAATYPIALVAIVLVSQLVIRFC